jgi:hypothetical protein
MTCFMFIWGIVQPMARESESDPDYLDFDVLCEALNRNDPNCTQVVVDGEQWRRVNNASIGYPPRLGRALCGNEFVKTIELQLGYFIPFIFCYRLNDGDADGVLDFLRQCATLRTVRLQTSCAGNMNGDRSIGTGETLLLNLAIMAVAENPHGPIALHLGHVDAGYPVDVPPDTLAQALRATTSLEELVIWLGDGGYPGFCFGEVYEHLHEYDESTAIEKETEMASGHACIAQAFRDNCSLKRLQILEESNAESVAVLVDALYQNGSLITVDAVDFTETQVCRVQLYCARNQGIADIISQLGASDDDADDEEVHRDKVEWLAILPTFFAVVQHAPRMAACRILQGLMGLVEELGPTSTLHTKRARSQR